MHRVIEQIHNKGIKAGVALNPGTSLTALDEILPYVDMVLVMSVNPGFGGQKFIPTSVAKIARLKKMVQEQNKPIHIQVDGGINGQNAGQVVAAGADVLVAGSFVFGAQDINAAVKTLQTAGAQEV